MIEKGFFIEKNYHKSGKIAEKLPQHLENAGNE